MEGRGVMVRECNPQINGFGGGAFMGDDKILSVIVDCGKKEADAAQRKGLWG